MWIKLLTLITNAAPLWSRIVAGLRWLWRVLWYPAALPVVVWIGIITYAITYYVKYDRLVSEAITYQDSLVYAQDSELWRLRADTLEANYEIRQLYSKLSDREKQEVIYFERLHRTDDANLQSALDSVYNRHARGSAQIVKPGQSAFTPVIPGRTVGPSLLNSLPGRSAANSGRALFGW